MSDAATVSVQTASMKTSSKLESGQSYCSPGHDALDASAGKTITELLLAVRKPVGSLGCEKSGPGCSVVCSNGAPNANVKSVSLPMSSLVIMDIYPRDMPDGSPKGTVFADITPSPGAQNFRVVCR